MVYLCDPDKNKECKKTGCQDYCFHTFNKEYAREDLISLEETIKHCEEVAEEQEDFDKFQCGYWKPGCEDGVWKHTCRLPSNIPVGSSWGECSEQNCPLFHECLECANEHRQIAEWLKKLGNYEDGIEKIKEQINCFKALEEWTEANAMEYALELLGVYQGEEVYHMKMGAVKDDRKAGDS